MGKIEAFQQFEGSADSTVVDGISDLLENKDELMKRIMPRLVNYEWNMEMFKSLPHRQYLDFAITYDIDLGEHASCQVRNEMGLSVPEKDLYEAARKNAKERGYQITWMDEMIQRGLNELPLGIDDEMRIPMMVVTNEEGLYGAYALLDEEVLKEIRERVGEFYVLPSSIHELIIVPVNAPETVTAEHLRELVQAVNRETLPREEWLSDSVYKYDGEVGMA